MRQRVLENDKAILLKSETLPMGKPLVFKDCSKKSAVFLARFTNRLRDTLPISRPVNPFACFGEQEPHTLHRVAFLSSMPIIFLITATSQHARFGAEIGIKRLETAIT